MAARSLDVTRIVHLGLLTDRDRAANESTCIGVLRSQWLSVRSVFNAHQARMAARLCLERRLGALIFLLTPTDIEGWCWLAATDELRAGTLGRHGNVDLHVPHEAGLSLRHCLFLVRREGEGVLAHVVDLSSSAGLRLEDQTLVSAVAACGPFFLHVPGAIVACFPTGGPLAWDPDAMPAFESLAPRRILKRLEARDSPSPSRGPVRVVSREATVTVVAGPVQIDAGTLLEPGEVPAGELLLASREGRERLRVGLSALDRGVVVGRYDRCAGGAALSHHGISRVHALLIRRDERLFLADAGSTNGTWLGDREIKCARLEERASYELGRYASLTWTPFD